MMCCARWLFARRCKLEENLHQTSSFLLFFWGGKTSLSDHKLLVLLRIWRTLATVWHFFRYSSTLISPSRASTPSIVVVWCSPTLRRTFCGKTPLALQNVLIEGWHVNRRCITLVRYGCLVKCPVQKVRKHLMIMQTRTRKLMHVAVGLWSFTWLLWWLLKYLDNFRDVQLGTVKLSRWRHWIPVWSSLIAEKRGADTEWLRRWPRERAVSFPVTQTCTRALRRWSMVYHRSFFEWSSFLAHRLVVITHAIIKLRCKKETMESWQQST